MIEYDLVNSFEGWEKAQAFFEDSIIKNNIKSILEIGAGANPTLSLEFVRNHSLNYCVNDEDSNELKKNRDDYKILAGDLSSSSFIPEGNYDLIFSRMTGEHISNPGILHKNIFNMLSGGGYSIHYFSTLYAFPFLLNKLIPENLSHLLLKVIAPRDEHSHGKFKAHYRWAYGPRKKMLKRFRDIGFEIILYKGYFGHYYYHKIKFLQFLEGLKAKLLLKFPLPHLTSYAVVILRKPTKL